MTSQKRPHEDTITTSRTALADEPDTKDTMSAAKRVKQTPETPLSFSGEREGERERAVGISEYVNAKGWAFHAELKQRFTDFLVNEVDLRGNVVHLTDMDIPESMRGGSSLGGAGHGDGKSESSEAMAEEGQERLRSLLLGEQKEEEKEEHANVETVLARVRGLLNPPPSSSVDAEKRGEEMEEGKNSTAVDDNGSGSYVEKEITGAVVVLPAVNDKEKRSAVHDVFKECFPSLVTSTMNADNGDRLIRIQRKKDAKAAFHQMKRQDRDNKRGKRRKGKGKSGKDDNAMSGAFDLRFNAWPRDRPPYLGFVLYKENYDSSNALNAISRKTRINKKTFAIAGTKDKRGCTSQFVTAYRTTPERLAVINHPNSGIRGLSVGNFEYVSEQLTLGRLKGNRFGIVLRDVDDNIKDDQLKENVESLVNNGFVNYFGLQRFGISATLPTYRPGVHIILREWESAFFSILKSRMDNPQIRDAIEGFMQDENVEKAVQRLPGYAITEKVLLNALAKCGKNNYSAALDQLSRPLRTMYLHSFQSLVWNTMVSERIRRYQLKPCVGDLVMLSRDNQVADQSFDAESEDYVETVDEEKSEEGKKEKHFEQIEENVKLIETEEEAAKYTMEDVVMPIPGTSVRFPTHSIGKDRYEEFMKQYGVTLDNLSMKEYDTQGSYRLVLTKPQDFEWDIKHYNNKEQQLIETDMDVINGVKHESDPQGQKRALVLRFNLPSSTYATMLVRELTRSADKDSVMKQD